MQTRKSIGDKDGERSIYVIERRMSNGNWIAYRYTRNSTSEHYIEAVKLKNKAYKTAKEIAPTRWTRKMFRVALYVRAE